jgi:uncharacterized protein (DUF952 family)
MSLPTRSYHPVPAALWQATDPAAAYVPESFTQDRFIHTTHDPAEVIAVVNRYEPACEGPHSL